MGNKTFSRFTQMFCIFFNCFYSTTFKCHTDKMILCVTSHSHSHKKALRHKIIHLNSAVAKWYYFLFTEYGAWHAVKWKAASVCHSFDFHLNICNLKKSVVWRTAHFRSWTSFVNQGPIICSADFRISMRDSRQKWVGMGRVWDFQGLSSLALMSSNNLSVPSQYS